MVSFGGSEAACIGSDKSNLSALYPVLDRCSSDSESVNGLKTPPTKPRRKNGIVKLDQDSLQL